MKTTGSEPLKRSVHGFVGLKQPLKTNADSVVAILFYGEADPSDLGHEGAGSFHSDVWALLRDDEDVYSWRALQKSGTEGPTARGWFASTAWHKGDGSTSIVLQGGLNDKNERLGDLWILDVIA